MDDIVNIALVILALAGVYIIFMHFKKYKKPGHVNVIDPQSQELYEQQKNGDEQKSLSLQEKIELSWQFLTNITKQVLLKFSKADQKRVNKIGQDMANIGMKYEHNVDLEVRIIQQVSKARTITQSKEQIVSMTR